MGVRPFFALLAAAVVPLAGCAATPAPAESALSVQDAKAVPAAVATTPVRTVKITSIRTTDATKGVLTVVGQITPAPAARSRVSLQRWSSSGRKWEEIGHGVTAGTSITIPPTVPGSVKTYRLSIGAQAPYAAAVSPMISFSHYVYRGIFKKPVLAAGGKGHPQFNVVPASEGPRRAEAELLADRAGLVWGDVDTTGCRWVRTWLGNITDGTIRASLLNGAKVVGTTDMKQETETWLNRDILGVTRLRLQVADLKSGYGPIVAVDALLLCTN
ncbi:hypothetical protein [Kribbella sp. CA-293567]|uniref:hypothetical protein n=1 Tax=Kribbella sp. CA-293567 TaxID=3002436 RepID=UPI0022DD91EC|nr:hypothetical protein [Kribbella sp. CA-293567]WBQ06268.1 hypothetical protein OX958_05585 [Kribbella sp. CA-293567]